MKHLLTALALICCMLPHAAGMPAPVLGVKPQAAAQGVTAEKVAEGSPAALAGIQAGDVLTEWNGTPLTPAVLTEKLAACRAGDTVRLTVLRGGKRRAAAVQLAARASAAPIPAAADADLQGELRRVKENIRARLAHWEQGENAAGLSAEWERLQQLTAAVVPQGELSLVFYDAAGSIRLHPVGGVLQLALYDKGRNLQLTAPLAAGAPLPPAALTRCRCMVAVGHHSRASRSGLRPGDTVLSVNGEAAADEAALQHLPDTAPDGAELRVWRVDHPVSLSLAPAAARPHRAPSLKVDWEAEEEKELRDEETRADLLEELRRDTPDPAVLLRGLQEIGVRSLTFFHNGGTLTLFEQKGRVFVRVTDEELSSLYEIGAPGKAHQLPAELRPLLRHLQDIP